VITGMIHREHSSTGRFRLGQLYRQRFKRPTLALELMVAVTIGLVLLPATSVRPQQIAALVGIGAMLLVANFVITQTTCAYFHALPQFRNAITRP